MLNLNESTAFCIPRYNFLTMASRARQRGANCPLCPTFTCELIKLTIRGHTMSFGCDSLSSDTSGDMYTPTKFEEISGIFFEVRALMVVNVLLGYRWAWQCNHNITLFGDIIKVIFHIANNTQFFNEYNTVTTSGPTPFIPSIQSIIFIAHIASQFYCSDFKETKKQFRQLSGYYYL